MNSIPLTHPASPAPAPAASAGLQRGSSAPKVVGRPWPRGTSGNPSGRRKGTLSPTAALKRTLTKADLEQIATKLIDLAKAGDRHALRIIFDRIDGPLSAAAALAVAGQQDELGPMVVQVQWPHEASADERQRLGLGDGVAHGDSGM